MAVKKGTTMRKGTDSGRPRRCDDGGMEEVVNTTARSNTTEMDVAGTTVTKATMTRGGRRKWGGQGRRRKAGVIWSQIVHNGIFQTMDTPEWHISKKKNF